MDNLDYIEKIEEAFQDKLEGKINFDSLCDRLQINLALLSSTITNHKYTFDVDIIDGKDQFLAMSVYPEPGAISEMMSNLVGNSAMNFSKEWSRIDHYVIEIDQNLFRRQIISFNPQELTALLLHELSHVAFSSKKSEQIYFTYIKKKEILKNYDNQTLAKLLGIFYIVPGLVACSMHNWNIGKDGMLEEYICDQVFGLEDYQKHMVSALNKIIETYGNSIIDNDSTAKSKIERSINWCNLNIRDMSRRRDLLKNELVYSAAHTRSSVIRKAYLSISARLGIGIRDRYTNNLIALDNALDLIEKGSVALTGSLDKWDILIDPRMSASLESVCANVKPATEAFKNNKTPKLPSDYDIDAISIEIDRIENHHDRIYVLDLIYNKIEQINNFKDYCEITEQLPKYDSKIKKQLHELELLRKAVIDKHVVGGRYQLYVKYPKGYEG